MSDPDKKEEKKKSGLAWWFSRAKDAGALARGGAAGGVVGAGSGGSAAAAAAAANAAATKAALAMLMGVLAVGGIGLSEHLKQKGERKPRPERRVFDNHEMDKPEGQLPGEAKPYSSLGMVSIGDMSNGKAASGEAAKAGEEANGAQQAAGTEGAAAQGGDQIAQAMAAAQAQAQGAAIGNAGSGRAARLPSGKGDFGKDAAGGGMSSSAHFGDAGAAGQAGPAARADNGAGRISSFAKGGAQTSRTSALVSQKANRARGFSARQLASVSNDASQARSFVKGGSQTETSAAAAGRSFDGASIGGQAITGAGGGIGGQGAAGGAGAVALGGGGGGGGGGKDTTPGPNNCPAGTSWKASSSACLPVTDDTSDECDAEIGEQKTAEGWKKGMEDGHVSVRDHRDATMSLAGASGCSKNKTYIIRDHRHKDDPDQNWIDRAEKILGMAAVAAAMEMTWEYALFRGVLGLFIMGCGAALTGIGLKFMAEGRYMLGLIWTTIGATISALAYIGSDDLKGRAKQAADTVTDGGYTDMQNSQSGSSDGGVTVSSDHRGSGSGSGGGGGGSTSGGGGGHRQD